MPVVVYWATVLLLFAPAAYFYIVEPFGTRSPLRDAWHHIAVLRELMSDPFSPTNPHVVSAEGSRYFGPIFVALALVGRTIGLGVWPVFGLGAVFSLWLLAFGVAQFARRYFGSPWAPTALLLCLLFAWGLDPVNHAGFHNLRTLWVSAGYPASMLIGLSFLLWALGFHLVERDVWSIGGSLLVSALTALAVTTHQLGAAFALAVLGLFTIFHADAKRRGRTSVWIGVVAGLIAAAGWPYYDPYAIITSVGDPRWQSDTLPEEGLVALAMTLGLALFGIFGLRDSVTGRWNLALAIGLAGLIGSWAAGLLVGNPITHRLVPMVAMLLQIGLAAAVLHWSASEGLRRRVWTLAAGLLICGYGVFGVAEPLAKDYFKRRFQGDPLVALADFEALVPRSAVLFADERVVYPVQSTGRRVVSIPRPEPTVSDMPERQAATLRFFDLRTSNDERLKLTHRYGATHVAMSRKHTPPSVQSAVGALGVVQRYGRDMLIVPLEEPAPR